MPVLEVSVNNFLSIVRDVESLDKLFCCSHLDCDLNSERLLISATTIDDGRNEKEETKIRIKHRYKKSATVNGAVGDRVAGHNTTSLHSTLSLTHGNKEAEEQEPDCLCAILKPEPFDVVNGGSYRCVTPKTLFSSLKP